MAFQTSTKLETAPILEMDPWLKPFLPSISTRWKLFAEAKEHIQKTEGGYDSFTKGFQKFGFIIGPDGSVSYHEWAPNATQAFLIGDFSALASHSIPGKQPDHCRP